MATTAEQPLSKSLIKWHDLNDLKRSIMYLSGEPEAIGRAFESTLVCIENLLADIESLRGEGHLRDCASRAGPVLGSKYRKRAGDLEKLAKEANDFDRNANKRST